MIEEAGNVFVYAASLVEFGLTFKRGKLNLRKYDSSYKHWEDCIHIYDKNFDLHLTNGEIRCKWLFEAFSHGFYVPGGKGQVLYCHPYIPIDSNLDIEHLFLVPVIPAMQHCSIRESHYLHDFYHRFLLFGNTGLYILY